MKKGGEEVEIAIKRKRLQQMCPSLYLSEYAWFYIPPLLSFSLTDTWKRRFKELVVRSVCKEL